MSIWMRHKATNKVVIFTPWTDLLAIAAATLALVLLRTQTALDWIVPLVVAIGGAWLGRHLVVRSMLASGQFELCPAHGAPQASEADGKEA